MLFSIKKLIPKKIESFFKLIIYYLFLLRINKYNSDLVVNYMDHHRTLNLKQNIYKKMKINFFGCIFFIPKTLRNAQIIQRTEKEKLKIKFIHEIFSKPTTYIDIGSNIGYWTFARNHILDDNITFYCFEPSRLNFMYLQKNLDRFENIKIANCGLSNKSEIKTLSFPHWQKKEVRDNNTISKYRETNTGLLSLYGNTNIHSENVKLITLDSYFKNQDIQGNI